VAGFVAALSICLTAAVGACYAAWGPWYLQWVIVVLGRAPWSALRCFEHVLEAWPFWAMGLLGGFVLLRGERAKVLLGPWLAWGVVFASEAYTSGVGWILNHLGPGTLIAAVWFAAALSYLWHARPAGDEGGLFAWLRTGAVVAIAALALKGIGAVRIPIERYPSDAARYVEAIESEFAGHRPETVLLDIGAWVYLQSGVVMKDRATSIGDRGYGGQTDFAPIVDRLDRKEYSKILMRRYRLPDFAYDHQIWPRSSGIRTALRRNYREAGEIPAVQGDGKKAVNYYFDAITVLVPKSD
jgi:hypothetical protein